MSAIYRTRTGKTVSDDHHDFCRRNVLIEDNCKSIGGAWQMCITKVSSDIKSMIKSYVVEEFKGIDHLPENISELISRK